MPNKVIVIKIGGSTLGAEDTTLADLVALHGQGWRPVVVHGGGPMISDWSKRLGMRPDLSEEYATINSDHTT